MDGKESVRQLIQHEIKEHVIAGANVLAIHKGEVIYEESFGYADLEKQKELTMDSIFRVYSLSKPVTAVAILQLVEKGMLKLTDNVSNYIDTFSNPMVATDSGLVAANREVTIFDLLTMTSGVVYPEEDSKAGQMMSNIFDQYINDYQNGKKGSTQEFIRAFGKCSLAFQPGQEWRYGASVDILGAILEVVTGKTLGAYLKEAIFEPLGMKDTDFYIPKEKWEREVQIYEGNEENTCLFPYRGSNLAIFDAKEKPTFESGGAGIVSTIKDYAKFGLMLLQDGTYQGVQILKKETLDQMRANQLTKEQAVTMNWYSTKGCGYGYLVRVLTNPEEADLKAGVGTFGWDGWTGPYLSVDQEKDLLVLYFISKINTGTTETTIRIHNEVIHMVDNQ